LLRALYRENKIKALTISQLRRYIKRKEFAKPIESTSETLLSNNGRNRPYALWENNKNPVIQQLWKLFKLTLDEIKNAGAKGDPQYSRAKDLLDNASAAVNWSYSSCSPFWNKHYPTKAADDLAIAVYVLSSSAPATKEKAISIRQELHDQVERLEKGGEVRKRQKNYLKANRISFDRFFK
jgi:hypothetical protein